MKREELEKVLQVASQWVGYCEKAAQDYAVYEEKKAGAGFSNWTRFGRIADMVIGGRDWRVKDGYAWCCMFLLSCLYESKAGHVDTTAARGTLSVRADVVEWIKAEVSNGEPLTYYAGCAAWHGSFRRYGGVSSIPTRGAFVLYLNQQGKPFHIGIVEKVEADGRTFTTIEGNTSATGSDINPNGGVVARKKRKAQGCIFLSKSVL